MDCQDFLSRVHLRSDLSGPDRRAFEEHLGRCETCAVRLEECERLDDVLLSWNAPRPSAGFGERVMMSVIEEAPIAGCAEVERRIHELAVGSLLPWQRRRLELHVSSCESCAEMLREAQGLAAAMKDWRAPDPTTELGRRVRERVAAGPRTPAGPRTLWWMREVRVPRLVAALVLLASALAIANLVLLGKDRRPVPREVASEPVVPPARPAARPIPTLRTVAFYGSEAGRFDVFDTFESYQVAPRGGVLRGARDR